jgi:hypothetical protein
MRSDCQDPLTDGARLLHHLFAPYAVPGGTPWLACGAAFLPSMTCKERCRRQRHPRQPHTNGPEGSAAAPNLSGSIASGAQNRGHPKIRIKVPLPRARERCARPGCSPASALRTIHVSERCTLLLPALCALTPCCAVPLSDRARSQDCASAASVAQLFSASNVQRGDVAAAARYAWC